jgi:hypothetical protein
MTGGRKHNRFLIGGSWIIALQALELDRTHCVALQFWRAPYAPGTVAAVGAVETTGVFGFDWALVWRDKRSGLGR